MRIIRCLLSRMAALSLAFLAAFGVSFAAGASEPAGRLFAVSNSHINKICQDHLGYIWLATDYGLTRFDGSEAVTFTRTSEAGSLLSNTVLTVMEDSGNNLWVGTTDGIQRFDRSTLTFMTPRLSYPNVPDFSYVNSIIEDRKGNIWFTTSRSGAVCIRKGDPEPVCYMTTNSRICSNKTTVLYEDSFGNIWIGSKDAGITIFNSSTNSMTTLGHDPSDPTSLSSNMIFTIGQTNDGRLFIGSLDGGIDAYDYRSNRVTRNAVNVDGNVYILKNSPDDNIMYIGTDGNGLKKYDVVSGSLSDVGIAIRDFNPAKAKIHDILTDRQGNLWLGVYQKGALMVSRDTEDSMVNYTYSPFSPSLNIGTEPVLCALQSRDGALWVGTDGDGIYRAASPGAPMRHITYPDSGAGTILTIFQDSGGAIWAGNYLNGLSRYNPATGVFDPVSLPLPDTPGGRVKEVNAIAEDAEGNLWLATNGDGVCIYNPRTGATRFYSHDPSLPDARQLLGNAVHAILFSADGKVWIGTSDSGLSCLDISTGRFEHFNSSNMRLSNNCVFSLCQDASGAVWAGTRMGLNRIQNGRTRVFNETHGLLNNLVYAITTDSNGNLWLSTGAGITCLDPKTMTFDGSLQTDRLACREFKRNSACRGLDGRVYFGGVGGLVSFMPGARTSPHELLRLAFNELTVINGGDDASADPIGERVMPVGDSEGVELEYDDNSFSVSFGAVEFSRPENVSYSVMLEGHDNGWIQLPGGARTATYSSLPPGDYTLRVKASIGDYRPVEKSLKLTISPPIYLTPWMKVIYVILAILLVAFGFKAVRWRFKEAERRNRQLMQAQTAEHKLQFFTDISHEIRTPLTMVLSPLDSLRDKIKDRQALRTIDVMRHNGERILRLIDQIMDLRRLDNNQMRLAVGRVEVRKFLAGVAGAFENLAGERGIDFSVEIDPEVPETVLMDADKVDKVVFNVLSNAFKFTPKGGCISLSGRLDGGFLVLRVSDTGPGIPADSQERVFNRFYRVKGDAPASAPGTGIGLHLARKMMDLHHGTIAIERSTSEGTVMLIRLPLAEEAYPAGERSVGETAPSATHAAVEMPDEGTRASAGEGAPRHATVLVIEDDVSILDYISRELSEHYNVLTATDGTSGLEIAFTRRPDLILTDIMMEGIDGLELCRKIRANADTCEIPVVMLTAKVTQAQRNEGILAGADAYITKPFNVGHLLNRVNMLIMQRRMLKEKYSGDTAVNEEVAKIKSNDERLFERVRKVVLDHIANPDLSVEYIAREIGVSRSHLQRRLKVSANMNPSEYIKRERMRHAALMLSTKDVAVSEVAYATGFSTLSHFSTCFKEHYGMSPTRYVALNQGAARAGDEAGEKAP